MPVMPNPEVIAHRGYAARYPENTLVALEAALRAGARHVEFDVQLTRDGVPVLQHDAEPARTTGHAGRVMDLDLDTIRTPDAGETPHFGTRFTGERIPTLAQAVDLLADRPQATAFVEIKEESLAHFGTVRSVLAVIEPLLARCVPISFSADAVRCARDLDAPAVGWVLRSLDAAHRVQVRRLAPADLFCDHRAAITRPGRLWPGPWRWALYEMIGAGLARELAARGADLVETMAVGELLAGLASDEP